MTGATPKKRGIGAFGKFLLVVVALIGGCAAWISSHSTTYVHRFRLSVEIDTPEGARIGASVIEVRNTHSDWALARGSHGVVRGEAVFVDLGARGHVVATLGFGPTASEHKIESLAQLAFSRANSRLTYDKVHRLTGRADLTGSLVPTMVTFADLTDPRTAKVVYAAERAFGSAAGDPPSGIIDRMTESFGPGVSVRRIWIEMVDAGIWPLTFFGLGGEPITRGIEGKLPALAAPHRWNDLLNREPYDVNRTKVGTGNLIRGF